MVPPAPFFLQCDPVLTPGGSGVLADPARIDEEFRKAWLPYFCRSEQRETSLEELTREVEGWLPFLPEVSLPRLTGEMIAEVVQRKGATAGSLDGWGWREFKALPVSWFHGLARISQRDATPLGQRSLCVLPIDYRIWASVQMLQLEGWFRSWVPSVFSAGGGRSSVEAWYTSALDFEEVLSGVADSDVHLFVADVAESFDTVDRGVLDKVLSSLRLPGWFRHAYFEYPRIPQGCFVSMVFIVALYLPWCRYLGAQEGVEPQLYVDNLKFVSRDPAALLRAARFTVGYVRLVGQEPAPRKCVPPSTSWAVRNDMRGWIVTNEEDRWSV